MWPRHPEPDARPRSSPSPATARSTAVIARSDVALALYVGHASANFECLRFASLLHAYIGHGDSDKGVSASNQLKAYDAVLRTRPGRDRPDLDPADAVRRRAPAA